MYATVFACWKGRKGGTGNFFFFFVGVGFCIIDGSFASLASFEEVDEIVGAPQGRGGEGGRWA